MEPTTELNAASTLLINALSLALDYHSNRGGDHQDVVNTATAFYKFLTEGE